MKLKSLIGIFAVICGIYTSFAATDDEIKTMLTNERYDKVIRAIDFNQLTNGIITSANVNNLVDAAIKTNAYFKKIAHLCNNKIISWEDVINMAEINKQPRFMLSLVKLCKNEDIVITAWEKALLMPETTGKDIYELTMDIKILAKNLDFWKRASEKILAEYTKGYVRYVYTLSCNSQEYKDWAIECMSNINENTFGLNYYGWLSLRKFDLNIGKTGLTAKNSFFFESAFSKPDRSINEHEIKHYNVYVFSGLEFKDKAIALLEQKIDTPFVAEKFAKIIDEVNKNKDMTIKMFPLISKDIKLGVNAACYLNDIDKLIDMLLLAKEELDADQFKNIIPIINSLDADYRSADIVKALRNINSRYTLRLYDDRETWEPILSKIRAIIDVRQQ